MPDHRNSPHLARMGRVYDFIQDHLAEELPVGRLAEVAILSLWHFQRVFQEFSGENAAAFVRRLRIERAANLLLLQRNSTVDAVAAECGFGSAELLARHFQKRFGFSPSQWRAVPPQLRLRTNRQRAGTDGRSESSFLGVAAGPEDYLEKESVIAGMSALRLERRPERRVIYTRHFQGYDHGVNAAFVRLWDWAQPRGLIDGSTRKLAIGLDNPRITAADRCRTLACLTVKEFPEFGEGIGIRSIAGGLYAVVDYLGPENGLGGVYGCLYGGLLSKAQVEALGDVDYLEHRSLIPVPPYGTGLDCSLAVPVRSL
jgi:AraC family transcriptional regulator